mmetsp:Transcript_35025/g.79860  ORF Transcript_35025/g.79860 Transcript_35025/m.79860 type:complete len:202 (+) Transcript_35025:5804-6409(+)
MSSANEGGRASRTTNKSLRVWVEISSKRGKHCGSRCHISTMPLSRTARRVFQSKRRAGAECGWFEKILASSGDTSSACIEPNGHFACTRVMSSNSGHCWSGCSNSDLTASGPSTSQRCAKVSTSSIEHQVGLVTVISSMGGSTRFDSEKSNSSSCGAARTWRRRDNWPEEFCQRPSNSITGNRCCPCVALRKAVTIMTSPF